jgi:hypothetical protein
MSIANPNLLGANSNTGEAPKSSTNDLLGITDASWSSLNNTHTEKIYGASDAAGKEAKAVLGTDSIFNPFYVFRYAKYGSISGDNYSPEYHKDTQDVASNVLEKTGAEIDFSKPEFIQSIATRDEKGNYRQLSLGEWQTKLKTDDTYGYSKTKKAVQDARKLASSIAESFGKVR